MSSIAYKPSIDGLRALAVIGVVLYHFGIGFPGGYVGVDVFFVISGYLITLTIRQRQAQNRFNLGDFWLRRVRRVLPTLVVLVLSSLVFGYFILIPSEYVELAESSVASMTFSANIYFWRLANYGYFSDLADFNPLLHIWSLAIEEQFYLLLPLVFFLSHKIRAANVTRILIFTGVVSFGLSCWAAVNTPSANFFLLPTRAWELAAGCLLALHCPQSTSARWVSEISALVGVLFILLAMAFYSKLTLFPGWTAIPPVLGTSLFIYANHSGKTVIGRLLSFPPIVFFGLISYSLYLWHWPVLSFSKHVFIDLNLTLRWILLGGVLLISVVSWKYVEQPFLKNSALSGKRMLLPLVMGGCLLIMALSWIIVRQNGFAERFTPMERKLQADSEQPLQKYDDSFKPYPFGEETAPQKPTLALWGDSHAACLISVFDKHCQEKNIQGVAFVQGGRIPVTGVFTDAQRGLVDYNQQVMDYIRSQSNIQHVILAARWSLYIDGQNTAELISKPTRFESGLMVEGDHLANLSVPRSIALLKKQAHRRF